jgi:ankyrin repeat protein
MQWHTPSISSVTPSPHLPHPYDAVLENGMTPNPSHLDVSFEGLSSPTDTESQRYFHQQIAFLAEANDSAMARPQQLRPNELATTPVAINRPSSASASPLYRTPGTSYSPNGSSSASFTSSMNQLFATQPSGIYKYPQTQMPLLHVAIRTRKKSMVRLLLRRGVSTINEQDTNGRTALHIAAQAGDEEIVEMLIKHGADPKVVDNQGLDALYCAVEMGHDEIVEMLLDVIARRE